MNDSIAGMSWFIGVMIFLFYGDPDIWDALRIIIFKLAGLP